MSKRKQHAPEFKAKVALDALKGEEAAGEPIRGASDDDPSIEAGSAQSRFRRVRAPGRKKPEIDEVQAKELHAKIGELPLPNSFLERKLKPWGRK